MVDGRTNRWDANGLLQLVLLAPYDAEGELGAGQRVCARSEKQCKKRNEISTAVMDGSGAQQQHLRSASYGLQGEVSIGTRVPDVMRFVDNYQVVRRR